MAALHEALQALSPCDFSDTPLDDLATFLSNSFQSAQTIVESVPIPAASPGLSAGARSRATSTASNSSEISASPARASPPPSEIEALQKEWKPVKLGPKENPLGMSVYKMGGKDGKGSWFARRSVHEGLGFKRWKKALEREFPETLKVQGGPGVGNIRGIGGDEKIVDQSADGVGKMEVYLLSAQFPGPTAPRDFVTMLLTSDQALEPNNGEEVPRHFMVVSKPCNHPEVPPRDGYIRGQYESVEFIREIPSKKPKKSASTTQLDKGLTRNRSATLGKQATVRNAIQNHPDELEAATSRTSVDSGRARGRTISFDHSRGSEAKGEGMDIPRDDEDEENPVEWIMITRSDPGGSVPRFLIDRGTPGGIVSDAGKFLDWACGPDLDDYADEDEPSDECDIPKHPNRHDSIHSYQTNGHLAGLEEGLEPIPNPDSSPQAELPEQVTNTQPSNSGIYGMVAGGIGAAGGFIASHTPQVIADRFPGSPNPENDGPSFNESGNTSTRRRGSSSSISTVSSITSFTSALETRQTDNSFTTSQSSRNPQLQGELAKLESKKNKLDDKLAQARASETLRASEDSSKEEGALRKAHDRHDREVKRQEEKYKKELLKLQAKKEKEERKAEEKRRKALDKAEKTKFQREAEELRAEVALLKKDKEILRFQVGELQKENTLLAVRIGRLGGAGEDIIREVKDEASRSGRSRASSLRGQRPPGLQRKVTDLHAVANGAASGIGINGVAGERGVIKKENLLPLPGAGSAV